MTKRKTVPYRTAVQGILVTTRQPKPIKGIIPFLYVVSSPASLKSEWAEGPFCGDWPDELPWPFNLHECLITEWFYVELLPDDSGESTELINEIGAFGAPFPGYEYWQWCADLDELIEALRKAYEKF